MSTQSRYPGDAGGRSPTAARPRIGKSADAPHATQTELFQKPLIREEQDIAVHHPTSWPEPLRRFHRHYAEELQARQDIGREDAERAAAVHMVMGSAGPLPTVVVHQRADGTWPLVGLPCPVVWVPRGQDPRDDCGPCSDCHQETTVMFVLQGGGQQSLSLCSRCWQCRRRDEERPREKAVNRPRRHPKAQLQQLCLRSTGPEFL